MELSKPTQDRLDSYLSELGEIIKYPKRKAAFATYIRGLFSSVERKTAEGLAALGTPNVPRMGAEHQRLLHVVGQSKWSDRDVRRYAAKYALKAMTKNQALDAWVIDDTGWIKKGIHSVGVQRQYTGTSGKVDNCQLGVSLVATTEHAQVPLDFALYLPKSWTEDFERRTKAKIPETLEFQTKIDLALRMIDRALADGMPSPNAVLADAFYGRSGPFRAEIRRRHLHYAFAVPQDMRIGRLDAQDIRRGPATTAIHVAKKLCFRKVSWKNGSQEKLSGQFAFLRVYAYGELESKENTEPVWLVVEKTDETKSSYKFYISSLSRWTSKKQLVRVIHERWRTERVYQDLKQEFGLGDYQGRSYIGWHHHVTAVMVCYAFAVAEQARLFPPEALLSASSSSFGDPSCSSFQDIDGQHPKGDFSKNTRMATTMPVLSTTFQTRTLSVCA